MKFTHNAEPAITINSTQRFRSEDKIFLTVLRTLLMYKFLGEKRDRQSEIRILASIFLSRWPEDNITFASSSKLRIPATSSALPRDRSTPGVTQYRTWPTPHPVLSQHGYHRLLTRHCSNYHNYKQKFRHFQPYLIKA